MGRQTGQHVDAEHEHDGIVQDDDENDDRDNAHQRLCPNVVLVVVGGAKHSHLRVFPLLNTTKDLHQKKKITSKYVCISQ